MYSAYFWWHDRIEGVYSSSMFVFPGSSTCPILFVILHSHLWVIFTSLLSLTHVELLPTTGNSLFPSMWSMHYFSKNSIYIFSSLEAFFLILEPEMLLLSNKANALLLGVAFEEPRLPSFLWLCFNLKGVLTNVSFSFYIFAFFP